MKRILLITIILVLASLVACSGQVEQPGQDEQQALEALEKMPIIRTGYSTGEDIVTTIIEVGSGSKTSDCFVIDKNWWYIEWRFLLDSEYEDTVSEFNAYIYPKGKTDEYVDKIEERVNRTITSGGSGSRRAYASAGEYYIRVEAIGIQCWELIVSEG